MANYGTTAGTPAPALVSGMALRRSIAPGCSTLLEPSDDTNDSATDFSLTTPNPRSNSVTPTEMPCTPGGGGGGSDRLPADLRHAAGRDQEEVQEAQAPLRRTAKKCKKHK